MKINFEKFAGGLVPTIVQDASTHKVLMLGYINAETLEKTRITGKVTFFSRSRGTAWTKGETSGNFLYVVDIRVDCDLDTILIKARPSGPICHTGADTCFNETNRREDFLFKLEEIVRERKAHPTETSYTSMLFAKGLNKIAQKVGEETVELIIEAKDRDDEKFKAEAADLLFHLLVLFVERKIELTDVIETLQTRRS